ncbi:MutS protein homolog 4 [Eumeta japonica]|uniref:MutS protein homolog 4 n=1 Tax=Eumeta variegata TaxID=151549 RepID=A0A4C1W8P2_EUMVA|nr:MutS protein homolog 4 [Eumeta japonica]
MATPAISEGRGMARGEIGMAAVDLKHPHLVLCQFSDNLLYTHALTKINYFNPVEIIVPHTFAENVQQSKLYQMIKEHYPNLTLTAVQRRHFNDAVGRQQIRTLCAPQYSSVHLEVTLPVHITPPVPIEYSIVYALHGQLIRTIGAAILALTGLTSSGRECLSLYPYSAADCNATCKRRRKSLRRYVGTATQLELVQPLVSSAGLSCCLLGILGPTYTVGGIRALRAAILQPSCSKEYIETRLDAVQEIIENDDGLMGTLQGEGLGFWPTNLAQCGLGVASDSSHLCDENFRDQRLNLV